MLAVHLLIGSGNLLGQLVGNSRIQGSLCGERPPKFVRIGKKTVRYLINDLDEWLNQRERYETIAQEQ